MILEHFEVSKSKEVRKILVSFQKGTRAKRAPIGQICSNLKKYLFIFGCAGSSLLCRLFSSCGEWGYSLSQCMDFSLWRLLLL